MPYIVGEKFEGGVRSRTEKGIVTFEQDYHFTIQADHVFQSRWDLLFTPGLPRANATTLGNMMCKTVNITRDPEKHDRHHAVCMFSTQVEEGTDPSTPQQGDPTAWIPYGKVTFEPFELYLRKDLDGKPWLDSAGMPLQQGFVRKRRIASVPFVQFESMKSADLDKIMARCDTINSKPFMGKPAHSLLLQVEDATLGRFMGMRCWRVPYTMTYKPFPLADKAAGTKGHWFVDMVDSGYHYREGGTYDSKLGYSKGGTLKPFLADEVSYPGLLKEGKPSPGDAVHYKEFRANELLDFNDFLRIRNY